jgi:hypothetical protein
LPLGVERSYRANGKRCGTSAARSRSEMPISWFGRQ